LTQDLNNIGDFNSLSTWSDSQKIANFSQMFSLK